MQDIGVYCDVRSDDASLRDSELASVAFDGYCRPSDADQPISTGLALLHPAQAREVLGQWQPVQRSGEHRLSRAQSEDFLLLAFWQDLRETPLMQATDALYARLLAELRGHGFSHLVRIWNYLEDINGEQDGRERYRQFCAGRAEAFARHRVHENQFPSACALGHDGGDLVVYALASRWPARHFENPRQVSAYHYPPDYGPRSPSFARASLLAPPGRPATLFVSGTASVVGHETRHPGDTLAQVHTTLENLDCLLAHVRASEPGCDSLRAEQLKVYLRRAGDLPTVREAVEAHFPDAAVVYVRSDICRRELMLEIEGTWSTAP